MLADHAARIDVMTLNRIWCETLPYEQLAQPRVTGLLRAHQLRPIVRVLPPDLPDLPALLLRLRGAGLEPAVWPMLDDRHGRWASAWNMTLFCAWVVEVVHTVSKNGVGPLEVAIDLEPPFQWVARVVRARSTTDLPLRRHRMKPTHAALHALVRRLQDQGSLVLAAVAPLILFDPPTSQQPPSCWGGWQSLLGTPVDGIPWNHVSVMAYTSVLAGWSSGWLDRGDALWLLADLARRARLRFATNAGLSLGAVGTGALGNEPVYTAPDELRLDAAVARTCGIHALSLFDLGGALAKDDPAAWLRALLSDEHAPLRRSRRAQALCFAASGFGTTARAVAVSARRAGLGRRH